MTSLLLILLIAYPDSARVIGSSRHSFSLGENPGNRVSVRDNRGWIHCVYSSAIGNPYGSGPSDIFYIFSTDNGTNWSSPMNVSNTDTCNSDEPNLIVDSGDVIHLVWRQYFIEQGGSIRYHDVIYSYFENGLWSQPVRIGRQTGGKVSFYSSLVIDSENRIHIVWDKQTGSGNWDVFYSFLAGDTWSTPYNITQDPYDSAFPSLAIDSQNCLHLVYRTRTTNSPIIYRKFENNQWSLPEVVSDTFYGGLATVVVDSDCVPHVVFYGYYTNRTNNQWSYPQRIINMADIVCNYFHCAIDFYDHLYVVWQARILVNNLPREEIYYCTFNGTSWSNPINLTQDTTRSWTPKLGNPVHSQGVDLVWLDLLPPQTYPWNLNVMYMRLNPVVPCIEETFIQNLTSISPTLKIYPCPAKSFSNIHYSLSADGKVKLNLYDISGRLVKTMVNEYQKPGNYSLTLNTKTLSSGVYFLYLQTDDKRIIERLVVIR